MSTEISKKGVKTKSSLRVEGRELLNISEKIHLVK